MAWNPTRLFRQRRNSRAVTAQHGLTPSAPMLDPQVQRSNVRPNELTRDHTYKHPRYPGRRMGGSRRNAARLSSPVRRPPRARSASRLGRGGGPPAARGSHRSLNPCEVSPSAELMRDRRFSTATIAVSSTSSASLRCALSRFIISSLTPGGVSVIASAYPRTSRSSSVKTSLSRQAGTARIFSAGTLCSVVASQYPSWAGQAKCAP